VPQIDGLRFLAIGCVLVWHASLRADRFVDHLNQTGSSLPNLYSWFPHGEVGVALFFVISGYVIAQPFLSRPPAQWRIGAFYAQRFWRIYPPYIVAITICLLLVQVTDHRATVPGISSAHSWAASVLYLHGLVFDVASRLNPPIWSLEVEIQFYLLAPLLLKLYMMQPRATARVALGGCCVVGLIAATAMLEHMLPFDGRFRFGLVAHLHLFVAGIAAADFERHRTWSAAASGQWFDGLFVGGLAWLGLAGLYLTKVDAKPGGGWPGVICNVVVLASVGAIFFGALHGRISARILSHPWVTLIGTMCYSIYLVHVVVMEAVTSVMLRRLALSDVASIYGLYFLVLISASLCVGGLFYILLERPFMSARPVLPGRLGTTRFNWGTAFWPMKSK
jgi:peptidoglycan/LPS O-acetylase OafA/YrhL